MTNKIKCGIILALSKKKGVLMKEIFHIEGELNMKNLNIKKIQEVIKKGFVIAGLATALTACSKEEVKEVQAPVVTETVENNIDTVETVKEVEVKENTKLGYSSFGTNNLSVEKLEQKVKDFKKSHTSASAGKDEVNADVDVIDAKAEREKYKVTTDEYSKTYAKFYSMYGANEDLLNINSVDAIVYYMNAGSLTEEAQYEVPGEYVVNDSQAIIDDMSIAREDIINYNINALMGREVAPIYLSEAIAKEDQKATVKFIENLIEEIANGKTKEDKLNALKELHSIMLYGDADLNNETNTEKYDAIKYNELTAQQQFAISTIYLPEVNVLAGVQGIDFTTYINDKKSNAIKDMSDYVDTLPNPLSKEGCPQLVIK